MSIFSGKIFLRIIMVSLFFAGIASLVSVVISTMQAQELMARGAQFEQMEPFADQDAMVRFILETRTKTTKYEMFLHSFSHPQFLLFWFLGFLYIVIPVFLGCLTIVFWNAKAGTG